MDLSAIARYAPELASGLALTLLLVASRWPWASMLAMTVALMRLSANPVLGGFRLWLRLRLQEHCRPPGAEFS
jgi:ABC-type arginine/histidine transport system permease subunit